VSKRSTRADSNFLLSLNPTSCFLFFIGLLWSRCSGPCLRSPCGPLAVVNDWILRRAFFFSFRNLSLASSLYYPTIFSPDWLGHFIPYSGVPSLFLFFPLIERIPAPMPSCSCHRNSFLVTPFGFSMAIGPFYCSIIMLFGFLLRTSVFSLTPPLLPLYPKHFTLSPNLSDFFLVCRTESFLSHSFLSPFFLKILK